jgi:adenosylcobinamide hydrolase
VLAELASRREDGVDLDVLVWRLSRSMLCAATTVVGGGVGPRNWALNAEVANDYHRVDVDQHVAELAKTFKLKGSGVGMLTATQVRRRRCSSDNGVQVEVTVGITHPAWAASEDDDNRRANFAGTINIVAFLPMRLGEGALLNALTTATEAKSQALFEANVAGTGTPSDAVCVFCPVDGDPAPFGGPRSIWGSRLARAVHGAVLAGVTAPA